MRTPALPSVQTQNSLEMIGKYRQRKDDKLTDIKAFTQCEVEVNSLILLDPMRAVLERANLHMGNVVGQAFQELRA